MLSLELLEWLETTEAIGARSFSSAISEVQIEQYFLNLIQSKRTSIASVDDD